METIGKKLRDLREQKNISLEEARKATKIQLDTLKAFEEDRFNKLAPVYVKSLLTIYVKFLGGDPENIIKSIDLTQTVQEQGVFRYKNQAPAKNIQFKLPKIDKKTLVFIISIIFLYVIGLVLVRAIKNDRDNKNVITEKNTEASKKSSPKEILPKEAPKIKEQPAVSTKSQSQPIRLGIHAKDNCWLKVVIDGKAVFQGVLKGNKTESWQANKVIQLSIGDASKVDIEVNGEIIAALGRKGQTVKDIKITSEGITLEK